MNDLTIPSIWIRRISGRVKYNYLSISLPLLGSHYYHNHTQGWKSATFLVLFCAAFIVWTVQHHFLMLGNHIFDHHNLKLITHCMAESIDSLVSTLAHWGMWLGWPWRVWADRRRSTGHLSQIHNSDEKPFLGISWYIVKSMWLEEMAAIVKDAAGVLSFWLCASLWCGLWESSRWKVGGNKQNTMWHSYNFKISLIFGLTHP